MSESTRQHLVEAVMRNEYEKAAAFNLGFDEFENPDNPFPYVDEHNLGLYASLYDNGVRHAKEQKLEQEFKEDFGEDFEPNDEYDPDREYSNWFNG